MRLLLIGLVAMMMTSVWADSPGLTRVEFETEYSTNFGQSIFVLGDIAELGGGDPAHAVKMAPYDFPKWRAAVELPTRTRFRYRFLMRRDGPRYMGDSENVIRWLTPEPLTMTTPGKRADTRKATVRFFSSAEAPMLEYLFPISDLWLQIKTDRLGEGLWQAEFEGLQARGEWKFRIDEGGGQYAGPKFGNTPHFTTGLTDLWVRDGQVYEQSRILR